MTTGIEVAKTNQTPTRTMKSLLWVGPLAMAASAAANLALYAVAGMLSPAVTAWPGAGIAQVVGATIVYLLIGMVVCALVARFSTRPVRLFWTLATAGLVLSLWLPLGATLGYGAPGVPTPSVSTAVTLGLMHVLSYAISVPLFVKLTLD